MDAIGGTYVGGGSSSGWSYADPDLNAAALGMPVAGTSDLTFAPLDGGMTFGDAPTGFLNGTVGGSWSPEPTGNNDILYGHYSATGALSIPQAYNGAQMSTQPAPMTFASLPSTAAPALTSTMTTGAGAAPATDKPQGAGGGGSSTTKKAAAKKPGATKAKAAANDKPPAHKSVTVKGGDTLSKIAAAHGVSWQKLYALNKGVIGGNPNLIRPGQQLKLP
jgi:LysM repeat protein